MSRFPHLCALAALLFCAPRAQSDTSPPLAAPPSAPRTVSGLRPLATRAFRAMGLLGAGASVLRARVLAPVASKTRAQSSRVAAADGSLLFDYKGFTSEHQRILSEFVRNNYPLMVERYGAPSPEQRANGGKTIEVIGNDPNNSPAYEPLRAPNNATRGDGGTIYFSYNTLIDDVEGLKPAQQQLRRERINQLNFTKLILRAFQGPNNFSYDYNAGKYNDIYQAGLADAGALLVLYDSLSADEKKNFDPLLYDNYLLHVYDLFNRPELSNAYIIPRVNEPISSLILLDIRLAMAQAAWLKIVVEYPTFLRDFNAAYYNQVAARKAVLPNDLRAIAAGVAPQVEGLMFSDWVRRQYGLDNAVTTGTKIFPFIVPIETLFTDVQEPGVVGYVEAFTTDAAGNDSRITGYGRVEALDENGVGLTAQWLNPDNLNAPPNFSQSDLLTLDETRGGNFDFAVLFNAMAAPNSARLSLKFNFKGVQTSLPFPLIGTTTGSVQAPIYGISQRGESGNLSVSNTAGAETIALSRGAFVGAKKYPSGPAVVTNLTLSGRVFKRNTAWLPGGSRGVAFVLDGAARNDNFTLKTASGASKVRMISLPIFPTQSDEAQILGIAAKDLKLARYRPNLSPGSVAGTTLTFGIGADRHEIYPNISAPMAPGRGYWLGNGEITRTIQGSEPRTDQAFEIPLPGGWNQFGVPFNKGFSPDAMRVRYGSFAPVSYAEAVKNGLVAPGIWRWQGRGGYARVDGVAGATLAPFEGFYLYAVPARGVSLVFDPAATAATSARASSGWNVPLVASTSAARDSSNRFGVADAVSTRLAAAKPPTGPPVVTLRFASSGNAEADESGAGAASGWADSFLASLARAGRWEFSVEGTGKGEGVTLSWGDLKDVPADVKLTLRDEKAGKSLALRPGGSHKWSSDGLPRRFSLAALRSARATLEVKPAPSRGVEIAVGLNVVAHGRLEIQNAAGDTICMLKTGDFAARTLNFGWSGQRSDGQTAPRGRYRAIWIPTLSGDRGAAREFDWRP